MPLTYELGDPRAGELVVAGGVGREAVRTRLGIPSDAFVVGCISRFHPKKRNDVVVDATVALDDPDVHLILAGDGETEAELRERARRRVLPCRGAGGTEAWCRRGWHR